MIPPTDIGVTFEDIGALENVKDTLKELVMLPLQRPELFCKGQLTKVCASIFLQIMISVFTKKGLNISIAVYACDFLHCFRCSIKYESLYGAILLVVYLSEDNYKMMPSSL